MKLVGSASATAELSHVILRDGHGVLVSAAFVADPRHLLLGLEEGEGFLWFRHARIVTQNGEQVNWLGTSSRVRTYDLSLRRRPLFR